MTLLNVIAQADPSRVVALSDTALAGIGDDGAVEPLRGVASKIYALPAVPAVMLGRGYMPPLFDLFHCAVDHFPTPELTELGPGLVPVARELLERWGGITCELGDIEGLLILAGWSRQHSQAMAYIYTAAHGGLWGQRMTAGQLTGPNCDSASMFPTADAATAVALAKLQWSELTPVQRGCGGFGGEATVCEIDAGGMRFTQAQPFDAAGGVLLSGGMRRWGSFARRDPNAPVAGDTEG